MTSVSKMTVFNPVHEHIFECIFENISKQRTTMESPGFHPIPGSSEEWCLKLTFKDLLHSPEGYLPNLTVSIIRLVKTANFHFELSLSVGNITDNVWRSATRNSQYATYETLKDIPDICFPKISQSRFLLKDINSVFECPEDKLVVKGKVRFEAYDKSSRIFEYPIEVKLQSPLIENQISMYKNIIACDVTFFLAGGQLKAHKCILMSRSPVFASMFEKDMLEKKDNQVVINDIDDQVFNCFLLFLYTGEIEDQSCESVLALYYVADKYQVSSLKKNCAQILASKLDENNACEMLVLSHRHGDSDLKELVKKSFLTFFGKVATSDKWIDVMKNFPELASEVLGFICASSH